MEDARTPPDFELSGRGPVIDVGSLIDQAAWPLQAKLYVLLAALAVLLDGYDNQVLGFALPAMIAEWHAARSLNTIYGHVGEAGLRADVQEAGSGLSSFWRYRCAGHGSRCLGP